LEELPLTKRIKWRYGLLTTYLIILSYQTEAQVKIKAQAGLSYIEHFSLGITCSVSNKHSISLLYGSDFFSSTKSFSSYLLQYDFAFNKLIFKKITPRLGIKGGNTTYTSDYYTWELVAVIPFMAFNYPISKRIDVFVEGGACVSFEQKLKRINYGEIESYKEWLPEFKTGLHYTFGKLK
jgi:hypothetical protein